MTGETTIQGIPMSELADRFGTPLYVYDGDSLREQYQGLRDRLDPALEMFYSLKANPNLAVCALLHSVGARAEVSSMTELRTALMAGVAPGNIIFLGPGKSRAELEACLDEGVYAVVCESFGELGLLDELARERGVEAPVMLRVNPTFAVKGSGLTMGGKARQFGIDELRLFDEPDLVKNHPGLRVLGVHAYMGTRILDPGVIAENARRIIDLAERLAERLDFPLEVVDVGGGLGVAYFPNESDLDPRAVAELLNPVIERFRAAHPQARLLLELGRYLAGPSGTYVTRVRYVKTSMDERFAVTDGGTNHHMAAVGIGSFVKRNFPMRLLNRSGDDAGPWNVTGPLCTPNDTVGRNVELPELQPGDLVGVLRSGAYGPSASPVLFLSHGHPAEVLVDGGVARLVRRRDTVEDLLGPQIFAPATQP
ncbi:diaminopimelate decarboxylase [Paractinoplanes hotanensis]|uniref:Diaminopimelate decarboxylase n=1 Tax=Paractinoplanes hotanensis TaxID=2906497 RepID=A0ABT0Y5X9_9ACTN|nr:diaminopimelate decarboxylase [Actinoplanes hotanensis]MCM4081429.1 diaminopimelate decarboxylase [Actinoplanes hotanensis]